MDQQARDRGGCSLNSIAPRLNRLDKFRPRILAPATLTARCLDAPVTHVSATRLVNTWARTDRSAPQREPDSVASRPVAFGSRKSTKVPQLAASRILCSALVSLSSSIRCAGVLPPAASASRIGGRGQRLCNGSIIGQNTPRLASIRRDPALLRHRCRLPSTWAVDADLVLWPRRRCSSLQQRCGAFPACNDAQRPGIG